MSKIRLGTTNIDFKTKMDVNRIFASVVSVPIGPAGALMSRIAPTSPFGLATFSLSNLVINGNIAYFTSSGSSTYQYGFVTRVDLSTNTPTALINQHSDGAPVVYSANHVKKASTIVASNASVVNTTGSGTSGSKTLTVASSTGILLYSTVTGVGITNPCQVVGINGNILTLNQTLSSTIVTSAVTFTDLPTGVHSVIPYYDTSYIPTYSYQVFNDSEANPSQDIEDYSGNLNFSYFNDTPEITSAFDDAFYSTGIDPASVKDEMNDPLDVRLKKIKEILISKVIR